MTEAQDDAINFYLSHNSNWLKGTPRRVRTALCAAVTGTSKRKSGQAAWAVIHKNYPGLIGGKEWIDQTFGPDLWKIAKKP